MEMEEAMAVEEEMEENLVEMEEEKKMMELEEEHMRMVEMKESENAVRPDIKMEDMKQGREVKKKKIESAEKVSKEIEKVGLKKMKVRQSITDLILMPYCICAT